MTEEIKFIPINIWDDFWDDEGIPEDEIQETYIYVEDSDLSHEMRYDALQVLLRHLANNVELEGVRMWMRFYDSKLKYPNLVGPEHEWFHFSRWEIRVENLTHKRLYSLEKELQEANLTLNGIPLDIYSES